MNKISDEQLNFARLSFRNFDKDGNNTISKDELREIIYNIDEKKDNEEVDKKVDILMKFIDKNGDGDISFNEFLRSAQNTTNATEVEKQIIQRLFDFFTKSKQEQDVVVKKSQEHYEAQRKAREDAVGEGEEGLSKHGENNHDSGSDSSRERIEQLEELVKNLTEEREKAEERITTAVDEERKKFEEKFKNLENSSQPHHEEMNNFKEESEKDRKRLEEELSHSQLTIKSLEQDRDELGHKLSDYETKQKEDEQEKHNLRARITDLNVKIDQSHGEKGREDEGREELRTALNNSEHERQKLQTQVNEFSQMLADYKARSEEAEKSRGELESRLKILETEKAELGGQRNQLTEKVAELEAKKSNEEELERTIATLQREKDQLTNRVHELSSRAEHEEKATEGGENFEDGFKKEKANLMEKISTLQDELARGADKENEFLEEQRRKELEISSAQHQAEELRKQFDEERYKVLEYEKNLKKEYQDGKNDGEKEREEGRQKLIENLRGDLVLQEELVIKLKKDNDYSEKQIFALKERLEEKFGRNADVGDVQGAIAGKEEINQNNATILKLEKQVQQKHEELLKYKDELENRNAEMSKLQKELKEKNEEIKETVAIIVSKQDETDREQHGMREQIEEKESHIAELEDESENMTKEIEHLKQDIASKEEIIEKLNGDLEETIRLRRGTTSSSGDGEQLADANGGNLFASQHDNSEMEELEKVKRELSEAQKKVRELTSNSSRAKNQVERVSRLRCRTV